MTVRALVFDVFGTVVDWRSSIIREGELLGRAKDLRSPTPGAPATGRR
jgi:FMN phosphatase YigB (HAD superfamily)